MRTIRLMAVVFAMNVAAFAQWVNVKLPNTPRTPDATTAGPCRGSGWGSYASLGGSLV